MTGTAKSRAALVTEADANFNDNATGDISAADSRNMAEDLIASAWNIVDDGTVTDPASAFRANKNGTAQNFTTSTPTKISWGTEEYDVGTEFASDRFTSTKTGKYQFEIHALVTAVGVSTTAVKLHLYKNGALYSTVAASNATAALNMSLDGTSLVAVTAGDYFEAFIEFAGLLSGTATVGGGTSDSWFAGVRLSGLATSEAQPLDSDLTSWAAITRASGFDTWVATPSSANLRSLLTDETGTGAAVFGTAPTIAGGLITGLTSFGLRSTGAAFDLKLASSEALTADRTLSVVMGDAPRTLTLGGNPTLNGGTHSGTNTGDQTVPAAAAQSDQETGTSTTTYVSPGRQQFHPSAAKCWAYVTVSGGTPTLQVNYNITSITDQGVGDLTITIATDFSSANWSASVSVEYPNTGSTSNDDIAVATKNGGQAAGTIRLATKDVGGVARDPPSWSFVGYGDQA